MTCVSDGFLLTFGSLICYNNSEKVENAVVVIAVICKGYRSGLANEETHRLNLGKSQMQSFCVLSMHHPPGTLIYVYTNKESSL